eukprot:431297-Prorocentrum_minimum.AAC.1
MRNPPAPPLQVPQGPRGVGGAVGSSGAVRGEPSDRHRRGLDGLHAQLADGRSAGVLQHRVRNALEWGGPL